MIEKLTEKQKSLLEKYKEEGLKIGLNTDPIDFKKAKQAVCLAYEKARLSAPENIYYCSSPIVAELTINILRQVDDDSNVEEILNQLIDTKFEFIDTYFYGQFDSYYTQFYRYFKEVAGVKGIEKMDGLFELANECGWCYLYEKVAWVCDRPEIISLDNQGRLHSDSDYAFKFRDGWGKCYIHGVCVEDWIVFEKEKITPEKIFNEQNKEIQRCMIDIFGRNELIKDEGKLIHSDDWGSLYHLRSIKDKFGKPLAFLKVINSTPECVNIPKDEIDKIFVKIQDELNLTGYDIRNGDVAIRPMSRKKYTKDQAESLRKEFKKRILQEIDIFCSRMNMNKGIDEVYFKEYFLQVNPDTKTAYEAFKSGFRKFNDFLPIIES